MRLAICLLALSACTSAPVPSLNRTAGQDAAASVADALQTALDHHRAGELDAALARWHHAHTVFEHELASSIDAAAGGPRTVQLDYALGWLRHELARPSADPSLATQRLADDLFDAVGHLPEAAQ